MPQDDVIAAAKKAGRDAGQYVGNIDTLRRIKRAVGSALSSTPSTSKPKDRKEYIARDLNQRRLKPMQPLRKRGTKARGASSR